MTPPATDHEPRATWPTPRTTEQLTAPFSYHDPMQAQAPVQMSRAGGRVALGCVTAVSLPFVLTGAFILKQGLPLVGRDPSAWVLVGGGALLTAVGIAFIVGAWYTLHHASHELTLREQNPDKPWLWREDWSQGHARESGGTPFLIALWVFAIFWNSICLPFLFVFRHEYQQGNVRVLLVAIFPAAGPPILALAISQPCRTRRARTTR